MTRKKKIIDPAIRFSDYYKVSPKVLITLYRLRQSEIMGKSKNYLMPQRLIAEEINRKYHLKISRNSVKYWLKQIENWRKEIKNG